MLFLVYIKSIISVMIFQILFQTWDPIKWKELGAMALELLQD